MRQNQVALAMCILDTTRYPRSQKRGTKNEVPRQSTRQTGDSGTKTEISQEEGPKRGEAVE